MCGMQFPVGMQGRLCEDMKVTKDGTGLLR